MGELRITGGSLKSRKINCQVGETLRPTLSKTREAVFNILANYIEFETSSFLDVFAGSGIMSFEAASRGFNEVYCIEYNKRTLGEIKRNIKELSVDVTPILGKVPNILKNDVLTKKSFAVIFVDPPYFANLYEPTLEAIVEQNLLSDNGVLVVENPKNIEINANQFKILKQKTYSDKFVTFFFKKR